MKILSLSFTRDLPSGITKQLQYEYDASKKVGGEVSWDTILLTCAKSDLPFAIRLPWFFRSLITRYFYCWYFIILSSRKFDFIVNRHMTFDFVGPLLSWSVKNRISVHHAIEPIELRSIRPGLKGFFASLVEDFSARIVLKNAKAIMAVTEEILKYQSSRLLIYKPLHVYPNGFDIDNIDLIDDCRSATNFEALFMCQEFSKWHGLEKLIEDAENNMDLCNLNFKINLVGNLSHEQRMRILNLKNKSLFVMHGCLSMTDYRTVMSRCHVGIASLALEIEGLKEGCTLKVREMLAYGIPVYSNHIDGGLDNNLSYYYVSNFVSLFDIYSYAKKYSQIDRNSVFNASKEKISKKNIINNAIQFISNIDIN